jgi:hypothetical protein
MNNIFTAYCYKVFRGFKSTRLIIDNNPVSINIFTDSVKKYYRDASFFYFSEVVKFFRSLGDRYKDPVDPAGKKCINGLYLPDILFT